MSHTTINVVGMNLVLLTRRDGVGINPVHADTIIYYDSDWNPAMDQQVQDIFPPNREDA